MATIIAKTIEGKEFIYSKKQSYGVPTSSAKKIAEIMNTVKWQLKDNEKWHVYEIGEWEKDYIAAGYQRLSIRNGIVKAHYC